MAFKVSSDAQLIFFAKMFGQSHPVTVQVKDLINLGVKFDVGLFEVKASYLQSDGVNEIKQVELTTGSTSLMKGTVGATVIQQNKTLLSAWVMDLPVPDKSQWSPVPSKVGTFTEEIEHALKAQLVTLHVTGLAPHANHIVAIKAVRVLMSWGLAQAKKVIDNAYLNIKTSFEGKTIEWAADAAKNLKEAGVITLVTMPNDESALKATQPIPVPMVPVNVPVQPVSSVIHLRDAKALGQKVHGTSAGSVYHCVALNQRVRVAARIFKGGAISIRVEWDGATAQEMEQLKGAGLSMKKDYASMHFNADGVPYARVIGAFVVGTGLNWSQVVFNGSDLVVEES